MAAAMLIGFGVIVVVGAAVAGAASTSSPIPDLAVLQKLNAGESFSLLQCPKKFTLAITQQGLFFAAVDAEWYKVCLALILLGAVLLNQYVRLRVSSTRR